MSQIKINDINRLYHSDGKAEICYQISDEAEDSGVSTTRYYGYVSNMGAWIIMKNATASGTYRYVAGSTIRGGADYVTAWAARESQVYVLFDVIG